MALRMCSAQTVACSSARVWILLIGVYCPAVTLQFADVTCFKHAMHDMSACTVARLQQASMANPVATQIAILVLLLSLHIGSKVCLLLYVFDPNRQMYGTQQPFSLQRQS